VQQKEVYMTTMEVGKRLVELCRAGKSMEAVEQLYSPKIVSIEAMAMGATPQRQEGIEAIRGKNQWWYSNHTVHSGETNGPWPHGDRFIVHFKYDITPKAGPMAGKRAVHEEAALYTVKDGKIVQEEFFYNTGA
jgi:hypothetical protein